MNFCARAIRGFSLGLGLAVALAGGAAAWALVAGAVYLLNGELAGLVRLYASEFAVSGLAAPDGIALLVFSGTLGWVGAWLSVARHLWRTPG